MAGKKEKGPEYSFFSNIFKNAIGKMTIGLYNELHTPPGKANLLFDVILAIVIVIIALSTGVSSLARIICSIFNPVLTKDTGDGTLFILLLFLIGFWIICLIFMLIVESAWKNKK